MKHAVQQILYEHTAPCFLILLGLLSGMAARETGIEFSENWIV